jgi:hypothetical protein
MERALYDCLSEALLLASFFSNSPFLLFSFLPFFSTLFLSFSPYHFSPFFRFSSFASPWLSTTPYV